MEINESKEYTQTPYIHTLNKLIDLMNKIIDKTDERGFDKQLAYILSKLTGLLKRL